jgi:hypothetical protein
MMLAFHHDFGNLTSYQVLCDAIRLMTKSRDLYHINQYDIRSVIARSYSGHVDKLSCRSHVRRNQARKCFHATADRIDRAFEETSAPSL